MSAEGWTNGGEAQYGSRNFSNSNYTRGPRREGSGSGFQGGRPSYNANGFQSQRTSGYGQQQGFGGGGGRQFYGQDRGGQRPNFGGQPRFNNYQQSGASSKIDIESNKVGMVIGRGGGKIREIQDNFNVHVRIGMYKHFFFLKKILTKQTNWSHFDTSSF